MRHAMAMIEVIFAIVIIAISVITIPTMMSISGEASKRIILDDDIMARLSAQMIDKFQARWGGEYVIDLNQSTATYISSLSSESDLNCSRPSAVGLGFRLNPDSNIECNLTQVPTEIPASLGNGANQADGNVSKGIEKLNGGTETLSIITSTGETLSINATYNVRYVPSGLTGMAGNTATATWRLGSSGTIDANNSGSMGDTESERTHLKRVVVRFWNNTLGIDSTLTFYKSNIGGN
ncbi:hypothetical protein [Sulfuricurvum sp.]|uniref:hypothetical protein n=1 Tax=Sulfuricurvum sp. TaxID=2025608 RepID=UPI0026194719|nr:hypothetical protein [Sulfuricurvum sp.]MDD2781751.1 hypothetical protein [Sulfuricurvum sp.]